MLENAYQQSFDSNARLTQELQSAAQRRSEGIDPRMNASLGDSFSRVQAEL